MKVNVSKAVNQLKKIRDSIENAVETGLTIVAEAGAELARTKTYYIPGRSGVGLREATAARITGPLSRSIVADKFYAGFVNFGRGPVKPVNRKVLRFVINGEVIFAKSVKAAAPRPFMTNTALWLEIAVPQTISAEIERTITRILK